MPCIQSDRGCHRPCIQSGRGCHKSCMQSGIRCHNTCVQSGRVVTSLVYRVAGVVTCKQCVQSGRGCHKQCVYRVAGDVTSLVYIMADIPHGNILFGGWERPRPLCYRHVTCPAFKYV